MCGVKEDPAAHLYWLIYLNGNLAKTGVDQLKPKNGDTLNFKYEKVQANCYWRTHELHKVYIFRERDFGEILWILESHI